MDLNKAYCREWKTVERKDEIHVFRLSRTKYTLNQVDRKEWEVMSTAAVLDYLSEKGFSDILFFKRIGECRPYVKRGDKIYVLMSQLQGQKLKLRNESNGMIFTELLARFHRAAEGFIQPPGIKVRVDWGKRMEKCRMYTSRLEKYINYVESKELLNEFEEYTSRYTEMLLKRARGSMKILRSLGYLRALESSMKRKEICINGISSNTVIINGDKPAISKIFEMGYNMVEEDIAALIKKLILDTGDITVFDRVISKYSETRRIGEDSENIIKALVSFPFDSIKVILKYYNHTEDINQENALIKSGMMEKFKKYISKELLTDVLGG